MRTRRSTCNNTDAKARFDEFAAPGYMSRLLAVLSLFFEFVRVILNNLLNTCVVTLDSLMLLD